MFIPSLFRLRSLGRLDWLAQVPVAPAPVSPDTVAPEQASVLFTGPQFFIALISGILLAFAIQLLLTNFSVAAGMSYLGHSSNSSEDSKSSGLSIRKISIGFGLWTLISVAIALFFATYLAVKLSLVTSDGLGAIIGLVIWAAYFSLLLWVSSSTVGSLIGSMMNTATSGLQAILGAATAAIGSRAAKNQVVSTVEAAAAAVRQELGSAIDPVSLRESVEEYMQRLQLPQLDLSKIRQDFEGILNDPQIAELADQGQLKHIDRNTFIDLVSQRTDFSREEVTRLAQLLEGIWQQVVGRRSQPKPYDDLVTYLQGTQPGQIQVAELNAKLDRVLAERSHQGNDTAKAPGAIQQTFQLGMNTLVGLLAGRTDLSDFDLNAILTRLKTTSEQVTEQAKVATAQLQGKPATPYSPIRQDVEQYLRQTYPWEMTPAAIERDFREVLYDPKADPGAIADQLQQFNRTEFEQLLTERGVFTQTKIHAIVDQLEAIRRDVLTGARIAKEVETTADLHQRIDIYLNFTPKSLLLTSEEEIPGFRALLEDPNADYATLSERFATYTRSYLQQRLSQRDDLLPEDYEPILTGLETTRDRVLFESKSVNEQVSEKSKQVQARIADYLRNTGKPELNPDGIQRDLKLLLNEPELGLEAFRHRLGQMDRDTLVQLLNQRQDLSEAEINQVLNQIESSWQTFVSTPQIVVAKVKDQYDQTLTAIADYLRKTDRAELNPEGIRRDLKLLLDDPKVGISVLRQRLGQVDRETLVQLLSQRDDLSEAQVNQIIDETLFTLQRIIRAPRRLALRTKQTVLDFEQSVADYLRNTDKAELNPDGIKRDFSLLLESPKAGLQNLGDRIGQMDRTTLIALLAQREDMTTAEAEQVVAQMEAVRDQMLAKVDQVKQQIQAVIDRIFGRIRDYLNSLERPELNYDGIKRDLRTLFHDPEAGFDALRSRLGQFDRDTVIALLSSRPDISEADANRIVAQVESARDSVLRRADHIQTETQRRIEAIKVQAEKQLDETRQAAAIAAWWLFSTALISAGAAAGAGALSAS